MSRKDIVEEEVELVKQMCRDLDNYLNNSMDRLTEKVEAFQASVVRAKDRIRSAMTQLLSCDSDGRSRSPLYKNSRLHDVPVNREFEGPSRCGVSSEANESTLMSSRICDYSVAPERYPTYVSPSIRDRDPQAPALLERCQISTGRCKIDGELIVNTSRTFLTRQLFNCRKVLMMRDTIKESQKILSGFFGDDNHLPSADNDVELRHRLASEIDVTKSKIRSVFFESSPCERLNLLRQHASRQNPAARRHMKSGRDAPKAHRGSQTSSPTIQADDATTNGDTTLTQTVPASKGKRVNMRRAVRLK